MLFYGLNFLEIIPGVSWLPLETLSIILLWRATVKARKEKEVEEEENNQEVVAYGRQIQTVDQELYKINKEIYSRVGVNNQTTAEDQPQLKAA